MAMNWTCPHCSTPQAVVGEKHKHYIERLYLEGQAEGKLALAISAIGCSAKGCGKHSVLVTLGEAEYKNSNWRLVDNGGIYFSQIIYPQGAAKPQPEYIPQPLRDDYREACLIRDLSPKAAATLVRRCLQGMIRDFAGISKGTLFAEIDALRKAVDDRTAPETITHDHIEAIDAVRGIGNIGAHMEKDINIIVEVDPGEAQALIDLVEMLFEEWYVARYKRRAKLDGIKAMADAKKLEIDAQKKIADLRATNGAGEE